MAVEKGGFALVWIGLADPTIGKIIPAAQAGKTSGYLEKFITVLNDPNQGLNQIEKDLQKGQRCLFNDLDNDSSLSFLRPEIDELGFRSSVALPLQVSGIWRGLINLYSSEPGFFDDDELRLLDEMAMDLSYAMEFNDQDVERRRAEENLKQREEIYHTLVEQASDGIFLANQDGYYIEVNSAGLRLLGYTREEILQLSMRDVTKHSPVEPIRFKELKEGKTLLSEREMIRKDGSLLPVEISARKLPDGRLQGIVRDISERKRVEETLRKSQFLLNETQRITKVGGWEFDLLTNKITWTDEVYQIHGVSKEYDPGSADEDIQFYAPEDQSRISKAFRQAVEKGEPYDLELRLKNAHGTRIWVRTIGEVEYREGKIVRVFGNIMDITERKLAEEEIRNLNAELEQRVARRTQELEAANKELEAFAYSVSHDLRAPLRAIDGFSRIILDDYAEQLDAEGKRMLNVIRASTAKMDRLIIDLLAISRATRIEMNFSLINMTALVNLIYQEISAPTVREQISFSVLSLPDAHGDATLLRQVWTNLISNAIKYTMPMQERQIEVGSYRENDMNVYYVKDNGVGFDPNYTHKLFGVFQRLHKSEDFEGTGVGLAIVQRIIQRHGGKVWAEGLLNQGATFSFTLQANDESI
jgi:PAS domain S-box-containing protein